jgi:hypothetical protein
MYSLRKVFTAWTVNGASTDTPPDVWLRYSKFSSALRVELRWSYAQNSLEFFSRSTSDTSWSARSFFFFFGLYTESPYFTQIWLFQRQNTLPRLERCWMLKRRRNARCTSSQLTLLHGCALGERSGGGILKLRTSSFKCYVDHSHTMYNFRKYIRTKLSQYIFLMTL